MSWSIGFDDKWQRDIGYGVPAFCDQPGCNEEIDRGLSCVCGGDPYGGEQGCGLYFCEKHMHYGRRRGFKDGVQMCKRCSESRPTPYKAKPDHPTWIHHKRTDNSWAEWRRTKEGRKFMAQSTATPPVSEPESGEQSK